ncbi:hypothetical protein KUTeg_017711 [Tegillarca granosa]|uniref:U3 small nucleolar RNA-associated protein 15 homolog n=1 Tax=Tegillarca granosa TaxID=220873 RepID=A0ABQ9EFQ9_TEGGR|nr:hypothetical protein KUTeg_017711 [Tegillarca granosa]
MLDIDFCPTDPYHFAVTNSTRVQVYSPRSLQIVQTLSRFKDLAYGGCFRDDGKLIVAGGNEGSIRLFDVEGKSLLRIFKGHTGPVHVTKFLGDRVHVLSGSDDNAVRVWDIPSEKEVIAYTEHQVSSYDHTVKMFDSRIPESVLTVDHGHPVESVLMFPSGGIFLSAGGNVIKVWDALAGGRLLTTLCHHHKTITSLTFCKNYQRLLSGSLDRHVKVYDIATYQQVHSLDFPGSVLSVGVSPDDSVLAVGTVEGLLSLQKRKPDEEETKKKKKRGPGYTYALKGKTYVPHQIRVRRETPEVTVSVLQELIRRGGIRAALAGRDEKSLNLYANQIGQSAAIDHVLVQLKKTVDQEINYMKQLFEVMGTMDTIFAASQTQSTNQNTDLHEHSNLNLLPSATVQDSPI